MPEKIKHVYKNVLVQIIGFGFNLMLFFIWYLAKKKSDIPVYW